VATDHIKFLLRAMAREGIKLPDAELAGMPFSSAEGSAYFSAMSAAANFAWANRQLITHAVRQTFEKVLGPANGKLGLLYDVAHNIAKIEEHVIEGEKKKVIVHRKGATRSFAGQPVIIPGSMGSASYVLVGTEESMELSFGSTCHGAGRRMSRHAALKQVNGRVLRDELEKQGILIRAGSSKGLAEEAPQAYKDIDAVVEVVQQAHLACKVARLKPILVIKG
jgi:tRNA-splicing ligase RtcB